MGDDFQGFVGEDGDEGDDRYNMTGDRAYYGGLGQRKQVHSNIKRKEDPVYDNYTIDDDKSIHTFTSMHEVSQHHGRANFAHGGIGIGGEHKSQNK